LGFPRSHEGSIKDKIRANQLVFWSDKPEHVSLEDTYDERDIKY
jgi:hypothetical protein